MLWSYGIEGGGSPGVVARCPDGETHGECEVSMKRIVIARLIPAAIVAASLCACVSENLASELYKPNFGLPALNSDENVDSRLLMNGLYLPKPFGVSPYAVAPYAPACVSAEARCMQQTQGAWSSFDP
jgi:hypothetical protein